MLSSPVQCGISLEQNRGPHNCILHHKHFWLAVICIQNIWTLIVDKQITCQWKKYCCAWLGQDISLVLIGKRLTRGLKRWYCNSQHLSFCSALTTMGHGRNGGCGTPPWWARPCSPLLTYLAPYDWFHSSQPTRTWALFRSLSDECCWTSSNSSSFTAWCCLHLQMDLINCISIMKLQAKHQIISHARVSAAQSRTMHSPREQSLKIRPIFCLFCSKIVILCFLIVFFQHVWDISVIVLVYIWSGFPVCDQCWGQSRIHWICWSHNVWDLQHHLSGGAS